MRSHRHLALHLGIAVALVAPVRARAQAREEILGYDSAQHVLGYVERTPSAVAGFAHVNLIELRLDGTDRRIRLITDEDALQARASHDARTAIEARVLRDIATARSRFTPGTVLPVSPVGVRQSCQRVPFSSTRFSVGDAMSAQITVDSGGERSSVVLSTAGRTGAAVEVPALVVSSAALSLHAPYDIVVDAREVPGSDRVALLLRSSACTPEGSVVPARAIWVAEPPTAEQPLRPLESAELTEGTVIRALAPQAHRTTIDEVAAFYDRRTRVVFDTAWRLPTSPDERYLVQYTRIEPDMPPPVVDAGQVYARFAVVAPDGHGRLRVVSQLTPPAAQNVFEGTGQEAFAADLNHDGREEVFVRAHYRPDSELITVLAVSADDTLQFLWRGSVTSSDPVSAERRRCTAGTDSEGLVLRCVVEPRQGDASRVVQRIRWTGGTLSVTEERR